MPFVLIAIGLVLLISAARNTQGQLFSLVQSEFVGPNNFIYWFISILVIGSLGYIKAIRPIANVFLGLVILVLFLSRGGFFNQFVSAIQTTNTAPPLAQQPTNQTTPTGSSVAPLSFPFSSVFNGVNNIGTIGSIATVPILPAASASSESSSVTLPFTFGA